MCIRHALLAPDTLMGRLVVGHGDLKFENVMVRSTSTAEKPQLVILDFDRVMRMQAACDLGCILLTDGGNKFFPPLENRRAIAQGYIDACAKAGVGPGLRRAAVDDVVFDMEVGNLMRALWLCTCLRPLAKDKAYMLPTFFEWVDGATQVLEMAQKNPELRQKVVEFGVLHEECCKLTVPGMKGKFLKKVLQKLCCCCCCPPGTVI